VVITMPADVQVSNPSSIGVWDDGLGELTLLGCYGGDMVT
jgi:hypothetical protein